MANNNHQDHHQNGRKPPQVVVVMVPFPAQGHLNQLLHLACLISSYQIPVHYVGSTTHNRQAKLRVHGWDPRATSNIHFHDFSVPHFPSPPPDPDSPIKFPSHLQSSFNASEHLRHPVAKLLRQLSFANRKIVVIHDSLMASVVQDVHSLSNAESYTLHSVSALAILLYLWEALGKPSYKLDIRNVIPKEVPSLEGCFTLEFKNFVARQYEFQRSTRGKLYNTCRAIEGQFFDLLEKEEISGKTKQWAIGPLHPLEIYTNNENNLKNRHICLDWLDKQEPNSVLYVSFGTTTCMSDEQIKELAIGLERSCVKFLWILRDADKGDVFVKDGERKAELPNGYEERVVGLGMVVREWAPQLEILAHPSVGGFMSHCGWNSCIESISMGVPIAGWPMHSDQPRNAVLVAKVLKIGLIVRKWEEREETVSSLAVVGAVRRLMVSEEGVEMRRRAAEMGDAVRKSVAEGGESRMELDSFVAHISR